MVQTMYNVRHNFYVKMGVRGSLPGVKQPGRKADHSPPTNAEVKNAWIYTHSPNTSSWRGASVCNGYVFMPL
jgi:hypothetical protein